MLSALPPRPQNYGLDLDVVQKIYEKHKSGPPLARNAPPVAGNIMWSRQLLRRIEEPMKKFAANKTIMATKESKRIVKTYNRVARALIEFETLWHQAWVRSIENAKAGLQATLIVRHPDTGRLLVNFDKEIMQLMRETKWLQRMGVEARRRRRFLPPLPLAALFPASPSLLSLSHTVPAPLSLSQVPESAKMVLLQEEKFKHYYAQLTYALKEYDRVLGSVLPVVTPLLGPHLEDLEKKIQPGMYILTWTSMVRETRETRAGGGAATSQPSSCCAVCC